MPDGKLDGTVVSRMLKSGTGDNNFVKLVRLTFDLVVPDIPFGPNRNGLFHLISNRNFRNFGLNGKRP